jgi:hypothetical protein
MPSVDVAQRRTQMGQALQEWVSSPRMVHRVTESSWVFLSGAPTPDLNLALVHDGAAGTMDAVLSAVTDVGCPTLLMTAGEAKNVTDRLDGSWVGAGSMPFMQVEVNATQRRRDPRVRRAGPEDLSVVHSILGDAFGMSVAVAAIPTHPIRDPAAVMTTWLLEDDGEAVSTVMSCRVADALTIWCMATPHRFTRRGYARALLADVMARADADDIRVGLLGATPAGKPLYDATEWTTLEEWNLYTNGATANFH